MRLFALVALLLVASSAVAADPHLNGLTPFGGQRGTEVVATFSGQNLNDAPEVMVYYPGITVTKTEVLSKDQIRVTMKLAVDCRLGEHGFRVRTSSGISDFRTFWVGALPVVPEVEPNNEFEKPQVLAMNSTVQGSISPEDVDYYIVECKKGQRLSVEIVGMRLGHTFFDPYVAILNDKRFELAIGDDSPLNGQDGGCSIVCPNDGKYIVMVRDSAYVGSGSYLLHVGHFPRPTAVVPAGGRPGEELEVRFIGDPAGEIRQKVKLPATADGNFRLNVSTVDGDHPSGMKFRVEPLPNAIETANANTPATALTGTAPCAFNGIISAAGETDFLRFAGKKGQTFDIHCYARRIGSPLDSVMTLHPWANNAVGGAIVGNDDSPFGPDSYFRTTLPQDGEYVLAVHDHLRKGGPDYFYRVEVTAPEPQTNTNIPKADGNNAANQTRQTISVPKGNRYATLVIAARGDWSGQAAIGFDKLPAGVTTLSDPVEPGQGATPVVFEAKADAPVGGVLADMQAKSVNPAEKPKSQTQLDVNFSLGQNNNPFHRHITDRIAVAVTETVPFSIEVVEPKVPLVQNGSMLLKVVAKRAPGFTAAISVSPVFTPPGMGIAGQTIIPENATECLVNMNAAPNALTRKWRTAFTGLANCTTTPAGHKPNDPVTAQSNGPVMVSSQLFMLEIAPPFVTFAQDRAAVDQGAKGQLFGKLTVNTPFDGKARATLIGLPAKVTAPVVEFTKDSKDITFEVTTDKTSPAGKHSVYVQVVIEKNGETIAHSVGGNELRIDVPLPPKVAVAAPPTPKPATPAPAPAAPPVVKRLTRLEQLRLEQEEREKAAKASVPAAAPAKPEGKK
ncbi:PPC domain-containing protein [Limnoglobus roseus]|uniref:Peptidase n=1 Tax=Limnoglobus roseus TaxID=2598579 RepID=A0A5C1A245_9BACT|nr:PPC domain-containing protein [Limnoglobus roseus]QEL13201.1 peptidase [Limnoglobus roseus]